MIGALSNHLWQSTMFTVAIGLLAAALRKHRAAVRYWLWFAASVKFALPWSLLIGIGRSLGWPRVVKAITVAPAAAPRAVVSMAQPFSTAAVRTTDWEAAILLGVWLCGLAAVALTRWRGWQYIRAALRTSTPFGIAGVTVPATVQIRQSPGLLEPGIIGCWRPVLLMPVDIGAYLTLPQLQTVVAHELCHVRRRDNLTAAIHMIVEAVFWFHPLVWWIGARLVDERERACDEHVLRMCGEPQTYAEGILNVCARCVESPLVCVAGIAGSTVRKRMEDIMNNRVGITLSVRARVALVMAAAAAVAVPIVSGMMSAPLQAQSRPRSSNPASMIRTKETVLRYALFQLRDAIDRYYGDTNQYPDSLGALVAAGYISQIPSDPFTNRFDTWRPVTSAQGIYDVRSGSPVTALDGTKYSNW